jgi:glycosyltransferase involved in cell wall biosynthesis
MLPGKCLPGLTAAISKTVKGSLCGPVMGFASAYLHKHRFFHPFIVEGPRKDTSLIVVIPCFNEPGLLVSLASLYNARRPSFAVEVIVVVNLPEGSEKAVFEQNRKTVLQVREWSKGHSSAGFTVHVIDVPPFPSRHAGAGFARKAGMDEAVHRFNLLNNERGIIVSFDADSECDGNYFTELEKCFSKPEITGCTIYFEHPLHGENDSAAANQAIAGYELYLRYFVQAMRWAGFPYAFHTIGSCFAVNSGTYARQGGMNRKTAGEDFYFLHKIFPLGNFTELNTTRVIPSSRISDRVPFGTGATMKRLAGDSRQKLQAYPPESFEELSSLFLIVPDFFGAGSHVVTEIVSRLPRSMAGYLEKNNFAGAVEQMNKHSAGLLTFRKRFFVWFSALRLLQYLNYARENYRDDQPVTQAAAALLERINVRGDAGTFGLLLAYRSLQRQTAWKC